MSDAASLIAEVMEKYNAARSEWQNTLGASFDEAVFHAWFSKQVTR